MTYELRFKEDALKEWNKLNNTTKRQFKNKLKKRIEHPHIQADKLSGMSGCYKIKLRSVGYRLVYEVRDKELVIVVIAVGKRDKSKVYAAAMSRLLDG